MNNALLRFLAAIMLSASLPLAGCSAMDKGKSDKLENLQGEWVLTRIRAESNTRLGKEKGISYTVAFGAGGKASGTIACNRWHGGYELVNEQIRFTAPGMTRKRCFIKDPVLQNLERSFLNRLEGLVNYRLTELELAINVSDGEIWYFSRLKQQPPTFNQ